MNDIQQGVLIKHTHEEELMYETFRKERSNYVPPILSFKTLPRSPDIYDALIINIKEVSKQEVLRAPHPIKQQESIQ